MVSLPPFLSVEIGKVLKTAPKKDIQEGLKRINALLTASGSEKLKRKAIARDGELPLSRFLSYNAAESIAYTAARLISSYGVLFNIFSQISKRNPNFAPSSILDYGCGPGSGFLAAKQFWDSSLKRIVALDKSSNMLEIAKRLNECGSKGGHTVAVFEKYLQPNQKSDLVICAFTLSELEGINIRDAVSILWENTLDTLVLVDRGTPIGFELIAKARKQILEESATKKDDVHILAPV